MSSTPLDLAVDETRYDRQELISWWDQGRLRAARILVVGAGALGNELVKNLALLGVGHIDVVDMDRIENSNLARCVFFRESDEGAFKAEVVARAAAELNPEVTLRAVIGDVRTAIGLAEYRGFDLVLGGLDNREARLHVNRCCWKTSTPWVDGAIEGLMGVMRVFVPPGSACYECTLGETDFKILAQRKACSLLSRDDMLSGKVPTTITSASVVAGMQTQEAVKLLHRDLLPYEFAGRGVMFNGMTHDSYQVTYAHSEMCMSHDTYDSDAWVSTKPDARLSDLLALGAQRLGTDAVTLDLEGDLITDLHCAHCSSRQPVFRLLTGMSASEGACPECGGERTPSLVLSVDASAPPALLERTPADLSLPPRDVITARAGSQRVFFVVNPDDIDTTGRTGGE